MIESNEEWYRRNGLEEHRKQQNKTSWVIAAVVAVVLLIAYTGTRNHETHDCNYNLVSPEVECP